MTKCHRARSFVLALFAILPAAHAVADQPAKVAGERPKIAVVVVFDQFRADYLTRWGKLYGSDGLQRLMKDGAWYQNCHYPYAHTYTACGHASIHTGCSPDRHGIVGNDWYDHTLRRNITSVYSPLHRQVPARKPNRKTRASASPIRLLAPTLADALKAATGDKGRVISLSYKDRSAVLPGGKKPDACYWFDTGTGGFVTSTYYQADPHPWVRKFNASRAADRWFGKTWDRLRKDIDYERFSGPDDVAAEWTAHGQGRTFPHAMGKPAAKPGREYYEALVNSPFGNDLLLELAKVAVVAEKLGTRDVPDLLCVSFSSNDKIGHAYGPDSQEVLDVTLRTDLIVRDLLAFLDKHVGKGRYVLAMTADHGVCPMPECSRSKGKAGQRCDFSSIRRQADKHLREQFGAKKSLVEAVVGGEFYLNRRELKSLKIDSSRVEAVLAEFLKRQSGILTAYTRTQLLGKIDEADVIGRRVQRSFFPARSGDVVTVIQPYSLPSARPTGTTHGSPHEYDTHVPLLFYGAGVSAGTHRPPVTPQKIPVVLAGRLGIKPPAKAETRDGSSAPKSR